LLTGDVDAPISDWMHQHNVHDIFIKGHFEIPRFIKRVEEVIRNTSIPITAIDILFLSATPFDQDVLQIFREIRIVDEQIQATEFRDRIKLTSQGAVRARDVRRNLLRFRPHIVHFSGHGTKSGKIILENDSGASQPVEPQSLKKLFSILKDNIRCILLNACFSVEQAQVITEVVDCVIGMSEAIDDESAIAFSTAFY
jgi:hypothetical protein